jgi:predicted dehydrogenase
MFCSGLKAVRLTARMSTVAANREVYDNAYLSLDYEDGVQGRLWAIYVAAGSDQGLWFRIFGEKGSLTWYQEQAGTLWLKPIGEPAVRYAPGFDSLAPESLKASRLERVIRKDMLWPLPIYIQNSRRRSSRKSSLNHLLLFWTVFPVPTMACTSLR